MKQVGIEMNVYQVYILFCYIGVAQQTLCLRANKRQRIGWDGEHVAVQATEDSEWLAGIPTGEKRLFDAKKLRGGAFQVFADEEVFGNPVIFHGAITWNIGEIDIAPETVYKESYDYDDVAI